MLSGSLQPGVGGGKSREIWIDCNMPKCSACFVGAHARLCRTAGIHSKEHHQQRLGVACKQGSAASRMVGSPVGEQLLRVLLHLVAGDFEGDDLLQEGSMVKAAR